MPLPRYAEQQGSSSRALEIQTASLCRKVAVGVTVEHLLLR